MNQNISSSNSQIYFQAVFLISQRTSRLCGMIFAMENKRAASYVRVSSRTQADEDRLGLPTQEDAIKKVCTERNYSIVARYSDIGYSGATADRPGLASLLEDAQRGLFDAVVVARLDRLARNVMLDGFIRYQLTSSSVAVISATEAQTESEDPVAF